MKTQYISLIAMLFFLGSCNHIKNTFESDLVRHFKNATGTEKILTRDDISHLPAPVQRYFEHCGFIGKPVPMNAEVVWSESFIRMRPDKDWMKLKTIQYNSVEEPFRIVYMKANMFGLIPFEGRDIYANGQGHMYGKVANLFTVFDEKQREIGQSALIIILAEVLLVPGYALASYVHWEPIDDKSASVRITHNGYDVSGIFFFNDAGEMIRFETNDRYYLSPDIGNVLTSFIASVSDYKVQGDYIIPGTLIAAWQLDSGLYEYWKGYMSEVKYNISL